MPSHHLIPFPQSLALSAALVQQSPCALLRTLSTPVIPAFTPILHHDTSSASAVRRPLFSQQHATDVVFCPSVQPALARLLCHPVAVPRVRRRPTRALIYARLRTCACCPLLSHVLFNSTLFGRSRLADVQDKQCCNHRRHWHRKTLSLRRKGISIILARMHIITHSQAYPVSSGASQS